MNVETGIFPFFAVPCIIRYEGLAGIPFGYSAALLNVGQNSEIMHAEFIGPRDGSSYNSVLNKNSSFNQGLCAGRKKRKCSVFTSKDAAVLEYFVADIKQNDCDEYLCWVKESTGLVIEKASILIANLNFCKSLICLLILDDFHFDPHNTGT